MRSKIYVHSQEDLWVSQEVPCRCSEGFLLRRFIVLKVHCSEGSLVRRFVGPNLGTYFPEKIPPRRRERDMYKF